MLCDAGGSEVLWRPRQSTALDGERQAVAAAQAQRGDAAAQAAGFSA